MLLTDRQLSDMLNIVADVRKKTRGGSEVVNVNKLKGKIVECGLNISELADLIGIDKATLYRKIGDEGQKITIREADLISKELRLSREEVNDIFFSQFVA